MRRTSWWRRHFLPLTPGVKWILVVTVAVHVAMLVLLASSEAAFDAVFMHLALVPANLLHLEVQGLVTMMLLHDPGNMFHILLNMLLLYSLGPAVEGRIGTMAFLKLYVVAGVCGSLAFSAWAFTFGDPTVPAIGASGAVLGVLAAFSLLFPHARLLIYFVAPIKGAHLVWLALAIDAVVAFSDPSVAVSAHVGGIIGGFLFIRRPWRPAYRRQAAWRLARLKGRVFR